MLRPRSLIVVHDTSAHSACSALVRLGPFVESPTYHRAPSHLCQTSLLPAGDLRPPQVHCAIMECGGGCYIGGLWPPGLRLVIPRVGLAQFMSDGSVGWLDVLDHFGPSDSLGPEGEIRFDRTELEEIPAASFPEPGRAFVLLFLVPGSEWGSGRPHEAHAWMFPWTPGRSPSG